MRLLWNFWDQVCAWTARQRPGSTGPRIGRMVVVAGVCASGKSTLCGEIVRNLHRDILGADLSEAAVFHAKHFRKKPVHDVCPGGIHSPILIHYDISRPDRWGTGHYAGDPSTGVMRLADDLDIVLVAPDPERLRRQLLESEAVAGSFQKPHHALYSEQYKSSAWLSRLYGNWVHFCSSHVPNARYLVYAGRGDRCEWVRCDSSRAAMAAIRSIYREEAAARLAFGSGLPAVLMAWLAPFAEALV